MLSGTSKQGYGSNQEDRKNLFGNTGAKYLSSGGIIRRLGRLGIPGFALDYWGISVPSRSAMIAQPVNVSGKFCLFWPFWGVRAGEFSG
jgi:hypothetical protein